MMSPSLNPFFIRAWVQGRLVRYMRIEGLVLIPSSSGRGFRGWPASLLDTRKLVLIPSSSGRGFRVGVKGYVARTYRLNPFFIRAWVQGALLDTIEEFLRS